MKSNAKSSITLPAEELAVVKDLQRKLRLKSKVEVVRQGLQLLREHTDRAALREAYRKSAEEVRERTLAELKELDHLAGEGL